MRLDRLGLFSLEGRRLSENMKRGMVWIIKNAQFQVKRKEGSEERFLTERG